MKIHLGSAALFGSICLLGSMLMEEAAAQPGKAAPRPKTAPGPKAAPRPQPPRPIATPKPVMARPIAAPIPKGPAFTNGPLTGSVNANFAPMGPNGSKLPNPPVRNAAESFAPADPHPKPPVSVTPKPQVSSLPKPPVSSLPKLPTSSLPKLPTSSLPKPPVRKINASPVVGAPLQSPMNPQQRPNWMPPRIPPQVLHKFLTRLGLLPGMRYATGKVYILMPNGARGVELHTYKIVRDDTYSGDVRMMVFSSIVKEARMDVHSAQFNAATDTIATQFAGINLATAKNTGAGYLNFALGGAGPMVATLQNIIPMIPGGTPVILPDQPFQVVFVPD